jgi:inner membrane protein
METRDYFQTAEVYTLGDVVNTDDYADVIYKPPVTPAVAAAKQSYLGRVYLDWGKWPIVEDDGTIQAPGADPPQPGWHAIEFQDLRFGYRTLGTGRAAPLSGWVVVGRGGEIEGMYMSGHEQR